MARKMPVQKPSESEQVVETPQDFINAVEKRWGPLDFDLACSRRPDGTLNAKAPAGFVWPETNALAQDWSQFADKNVWLNPEFGDISRFAIKCAQAAPYLRRGKIFMLVPAAFDANWYRDFVDGEALVQILESRIKFVGHKAGYPKGLILCLYGPGLVGMTRWDWKGGKR